MNEIIEYILANYTWIIGGTIIIFLAIIGYYADKTNFGQGKQNGQNTQENNIEGTQQTENILKKVNGVRINSLVDVNRSEEVKDYNKEVNTPTEVAHQTIQTNENIDKQQESYMVPEELGGKMKSQKNLSQTIETNESIEEQPEFDKNFEEFNEEFDEFLPEKDVIDGDLLDEIDDLSLDKTQKLKLSDIPDLDDVELPKIKNLKSIDEDIWKF